MIKKGNLGNLIIIIVPAICNENGSPFGDTETCRSIGVSYASFSMAVSYSTKITSFLSLKLCLPAHLTVNYYCYSLWFPDWQYLHLDLLLSPCTNFIFEI